MSEKSYSRAMNVGKVLALALAGGTSFGTSHASTDVIIENPGPRALDGSNSNPSHPTFGTAGTQLLREASGSHYADGISAMARPTGPSPRAVSNVVFHQEASIPHHLGVSDFIWTFGQFLDHDFSLTEGMVFDGSTAAFIQIPQGDPFFDPSSTGTQLMPFHRGFFDTNTGTTTPRQQINEITGYIDGSNIYGSDATRGAFLRTFSGGRLKVASTSVGDMAPFNDGTIGNAGSPERPDLSTSLFVSGDIRINEQPTLAVMHTLFIREHNFQAAKIAAANPSMSDEDIFQSARRIVIAEMEHIAVDEFLPALLGNATGIGAYQGFSAGTNAGISAAFGTAAYRVGHTLLSPFIQRLNPDGSSISEGPLSLRDSFFAAAPPLLLAHGIEPFLRGVAAQKSQELDNKVIDDVRNFLFGAPGSGGVDLISLNVQRGRDMGLADFNTLRADFGLPRLTSFSQITKDTTFAAQLQQLFGSIDNVDPFAGLFAEDHAKGFNVGPTLLAVISDQFKRSRAGDFFWYERTFTGSDLTNIKNTHLSDIIKRNTTITNIQSNVFFIPGFSQPSSDPGI